MIKKFLLVITVISITIIPTAIAQNIKKITVLSNEHPMALWHKPNHTQKPLKKGPILLLHGRTWSALPDFDLQVSGEKLSLMDNLQALGFDVWALDARGYGATPRDKSGWNHPNKAATDVANVLRFITTKTGKKPTLFGWSYGSMTAQLTIQKHPDLATSVVLYGYPIDPEVHIATSHSSVKPKREKNTAQNAASDFIVENSISKQAISTYVTESLKADPIRADWRYLEQWNQLNAKDVQLPLLLLQAEHDPLAKDEAHARFFIKLPNANKQWTVLAGGDHAALLETPKHRLAQTVADFVVWLDK